VIIPFSTFAPDVAIEVPGCPQPLIEHHAMHAVSLFCKETRRLRETLPAVSVVANQGAYSVTPSSPNFKVVRVENVLLNGEPLAPISESELDAEMPDWRTQTGVPCLFVWYDEKLQLVPAPSTAATDALVVRISYTLDVSVSQTGFDKLLYQEYSDGLAAGIKARLMAIPGRGWSNPELAAFYQTAFKVAIAKGRLDASGGLTRSRLRTRMHA
jgi:hypothetical protein